MDNAIGVRDMEAEVRRSVRVEEPAATATKAIYGWAAAGLFFTAMNLWVFGSATRAGDFMHRADPGVTPIPEWMRINFLVQDTFWGCAIVATFYIWVCRPLLKSGQFSREGLAWLGLASVLWQDPLEGYVNLVFSYNTAAFNIGGWACHIPGWASPGGCGIVEPIFWLPAFYLVCVCGLLVGSTHVMGRIKSKHPNISNLKLFGGIFLFVAAFDIVFEMSEIALGYYHYGGLALSIFPNTRFRFPLFEPFLVAALFLVWAIPYYFKNDKGETLAERGLSAVQGGSAKKQGLRLLAFVGIMNIGYIVAYNGPIIFISLVEHAEWPEDVQNKSYFTNRMCGEGTTYACGGSNVATARKGDSMHIGPNGELVIPPGTKVPKVVPLLRTAEN